MGQDDRPAVGSSLDQLRSVAGCVVRDCGLEIFDVQFRRESIGWVLRVIVDRPPGDADHAQNGEVVSVADCQRVSKDLSAVLDAEVTLDHAYTLEVSSPGLDRPLRHLSDCRRFQGRLASFVASEAVNGQRHLVGRIAEVEEAETGDGWVMLRIHRRLHRIPWSVVRRAKLEVEF